MFCHLPSSRPRPSETRSHFLSRGPLQPFPEAIKASWQQKSCCRVSVRPRLVVRRLWRGKRRRTQRKRIRFHTASAAAAYRVIVDHLLQALCELHEAGLRGQKHSGSRRLFTQQANSIYAPHVTDRYLLDLDCLRCGNTINVVMEFFGLELL